MTTLCPVRQRGIPHPPRSRTLTTVRRRALTEVHHRLGDSPARPEVEHVLGRPITWAALTALHHGITAPIVTAAVEPYLGPRAQSIVQGLATIAAEPAIGALAARITGNSIRHTMGPMLDPHDAHELHVAERIVQGAYFVRRTIEQGLRAAQDLRHTVGLEVELCPSRTVPGAIDPPLYSADDLYEAIAAHLAATGHTAALRRIPGTFQFDPDAKIFLIARRQFLHQGRRVELIEVPWSRAIRYYVRTFDAAGAVHVSAPQDGVRVVHNSRTAALRGRLQPALPVEGATQAPLIDTQRILILRSPAVTDATVEDEAYAAVAAKLGLRSADTVRDLEARNGADFLRSDIWMTTDRKKWKAFFRIEQTGPQRFRCTPLNGRFLDGTVNALMLPATSFADAITQYREHVRSTPPFLARTDNIAGLQIDDIEGRFNWHYEPFPYRELVSPKLTTRDFPVIDRIIEAFANLGVIGTMPNTQVTTHVHGNALVRVNGQINVAPLLNVARTSTRYAPILRAVFPPNPNGLVFVQPMPRRLRNRILRRDYVTQPTDVRQILGLMADLMIDMKPKHSYVNFDNIVTDIGAALIESGQLSVGQDPINVHWHGRPYQFHVVDDDTTESIDIQVVYREQTHSLMRVLPRKRKHTHEFRGLTTPHRVTPHASGPDTYAIDPASIRLFLEFVAARSTLDGVLPFVSELTN